jgi:hypothetical protein
MVGLEYEADRQSTELGEPPLRNLCDRRLGDGDATGERSLEPTDEIEQRTLPASGRPGDYDELALANLQVNAREHRNCSLVTTITVRDGLQ